MRPATLLALGACGGALAAFVFIALAASRTVSTPSATLSDTGLEPNARPQAVLDSATQRAAERAAESPDAALREALALESDAMRTTAAAQVARVWARQDARAALAAAEQLPADYRAAFLSAAASEWAFVDPVGFFTYAEAAASIDALIAGLELLIATDPERVFEIAGRFNGPNRPEIEALYLHAIRGMAGRDPVGTAARLQAVATGEQRDPILASIAEAYAVIDADAAFVWAMSVMPPSMDALGKVMETVASNDLLRAYEMLQQVPRNAANTSTLAAAMVDAALRGRQSPAPLASALAVRTEPEAAAMLQSLMQRWVLREPESAVEWMAGNEAWLTDQLARVAVSGLAFEDVGLAAELAQRVPPSAQHLWLDAVANRYGQFNAEAGVDWLVRYEGRQDYDELLTSLLRGATISSPEFVAEYIGTSDIYFDQSLVAQTAMSYVQRNPEAAAQWAMQIDDPEYAEWALEGVVDRWTQRDAPAAARWVLNQPRGSARDRLLDTMLLTSVVNPDADPEAMLAAYSSEASAQRTLSQFIFRSTRVPSGMLDASLARAEAMLEHITDPLFRQQAEDQIEAAR